MPLRIVMGSANVLFLFAPKGRACSLKEAKKSPLESFRADLRLLEHWNDQILQPLLRQLLDYLKTMPFSNFNGKTIKNFITDILIEERIFDNQPQAEPCIRMAFRNYLLGQQHTLLLFEQYFAEGIEEIIDTLQYGKHDQKAGLGFDYRIFQEMDLHQAA